MFVPTNRPLVCCLWIWRVLAPAVDDGNIPISMKHPQTESSSDKVIGSIGKQCPIYCICLHKKVVNLLYPLSELPYVWWLTRFRGKKRPNLTVNASEIIQEPPEISNKHVGKNIQKHVLLNGTSRKPANSNHLGTSNRCLQVGHKGIWYPKHPCMVYIYLQFHIDIN